MPFNYFVRSAIYEVTIPATFESCIEGTDSAICLQEATPGDGVPGAEILTAFEQVMPIANAEDNTVRDILILIAIGMVYKILYTIGVIYKTRQVTQIHNEVILSNTDKTPHNSKSTQTKNEIDSQRAVVEYDHFGLPAHVIATEIEV